MPNDDYRKMLVEQECESSHLLDNSITLVSTGALVVSISLLQKFTEHTWLMKCSWICLLLSVAMQLFSYWTSERAFQKQVVLYDADEHDTKKNIWTVATRVFNYGLRIAFALGMILLVIYGFLTIK
jgi:hypothetical protein